MKILKYERGNMKDKKNFAVIDTETTWDDVVMSIGVVIADADTKEVVEAKYFLIDPEYTHGGMYSSALEMSGIEEMIIDTRENVLVMIDKWLKDNKVERLLAYNAAFDRNHLPEFKTYTWCDIMRLAAYRQYNTKIPIEVECCASGRMKRGYGVEPILQMLGQDKNYEETHNAYFDALDELKIVQLLGHNIEMYDHAIIGLR